MTDDDQRSQRSTINSQRLPLITDHRRVGKAEG